MVNILILPLNDLFLQFWRNLNTNMKIHNVANTVIRKPFQIPFLCNTLYIIRTYIAWWRGTEQDKGPRQDSHREHTVVIRNRDDERKKGDDGRRQRPPPPEVTASNVRQCFMCLLYYTYGWSFRTITTGQQYYLSNISDAVVRA